MNPASGIHFILLSLCSCLKWTSSYAQLSISVDPPNPSIGDNVKITCNINSFSTGTASWFVDGSLVSLTSCDNSGFCSTTSFGNYTFSSNAVSIIVEIMSFASSQYSKTWKCQYGAFSVQEVITAKSTPVPSASTLSTYLLLLLLLLVIPIFIILICCGCLDCCKCCRNYDHYDKKKSCYVTWYCSKKGCCSFFYCTPGSKMGKCFGGHANEMERCGGCHFFRKNCGCGWPDLCTSKKIRSCGSCYCSCCVKEVVDTDLDRTSMAMTRLKVAQDAEGYIASESDDVWYNTETTGHCQNHDEHSVWYDATEEPELSDHEEHITDNDDSDDTRIYIGAPITVAQSAILILSFAMRHNLTGECLSDLLTLISLHCITTNFLHLSLYRFRSYFSSLKAPLVFHKFCSKCEFLVEDSINECTVCSSDLSDKNNTSYFVEIPLLFQIQQLFQRSEFHHNLMHRFSRKKKIANNIEDIYDGELYKKYSHPGCFLDKSNNISFMWYTDGVPLFKSSKVSIWPLFFSINELPIQERFKRENMLFAGLWFGRSKPSMSCFLKPFHDSLNKFRDDGFEITCAHCSALITVKGMLLCGTCDLPAKCIVLNMTQFNGKHGCPKCKQEGNVIKTGKGHTRVFPFDACLIDGPKRNHEEFIQHGEEAFASSTPAFGVKGPSWWANCCPDIINGTAIDYMHSVLLGLVRRLLQLWFDPKYSCQSFSISNLVNVADKRLSLIKPPYFIHRHPRNIKEQSKYWKASECRAWLFFYSVPVLFGLLKQQFFQHYLLFVEAIYILNLDSISNDDLKHCEELLIKFSCIFSVLYGEQHMSANLHQMLHLHDTVKHLGPLWVYSCFSFESMNGKLVNLFHGTQNPVIQIANAVSTVLKLPALSHQIADATPIGQFFNKLTSTNSHYRITETICDGAYIIGGKHLKQLDDKYIATLSQSVHFAFGNCYMFYRILLNGVLYHSMKYNTYSRNSCTIVYKVHDIYYCGQIVFYVKLYPICHCDVTACKCTAVFLAVVQKIRLDKKCAFLQDNTDLVYAKLEHIYTGKITNECIAVSIEDIIGLGICVSFSHEKMCISLRPNTVESD